MLMFSLVLHLKPTTMGREKRKGTKQKAILEMHSLKTRRYISQGHKIFIRFIRTLYIVDFGQKSVLSEALLQRQ